MKLSPVGSLTESTIQYQTKQKVTRGVFYTRNIQQMQIVIIEYLNIKIMTGGDIRWLAKHCRNVFAGKCLQGISILLCIQRM